jgi:glycosyltransferase involved in cell wall biosynthesis
MVSLHAQDAERQRLGRLAAARAAELTWDRTVDDTLAVYRRLAGD